MIKFLYEHRLRLFIIPFLGLIVGVATAAQLPLPMEISLHSGITALGSYISHALLIVLTAWSFRKKPIIGLIVGLFTIAIASATFVVLAFWYQEHMHSALVQWSSTSNTHPLVTTWSSPRIRFFFVPRRSWPLRSELNYYIYWLALTFVFNIITTIIIRIILKTKYLWIKISLIIASYLLFLYAIYYSSFINKPVWRSGMTTVYADMSSIMLEAMYFMIFLNAVFITPIIIAIIKKKSLDKQPQI